MRTSSASSFSSSVAERPPTVLILGANGRLGCAVAQAFQAAGWSVLAQVRREASPLLPAGITTLRVALAHTEPLAAAAAKASVIVHAVNPIYTRWDAEALPALRSGLELAERLGAHFMLPGNVYNYGADMPPVLTEDVPARPTTRKGEIRVAMEAMMAERSKAAAFPASVVRAGDFFGMGTGSWFDQAIVKSLASGRLVYPGPMDVPHAWAYLPDLAQAFVRLASQAPVPGFHNWHFEGSTLTGTQLLGHIEAAATALGIAPERGFRQGEMPWRLIAAVGVVVPMWRELARMSYLWRVPHRLDGRRLATLGGAASGATPVPQAVRESLLSLGFGAAPVVRPAH